VLPIRDLLLICYNPGILSRLIATDLTDLLFLFRYKRNGRMTLAVAEEGKVKWQHARTVALDQAIIQLLLCYSLCHDFEDNRRIWRIRHSS